jgi:hypothetical protein
MKDIQKIPISNDYVAIVETAISTIALDEPGTSTGQAHVCQQYIHEVAIGKRVLMICTSLAVYETASADTVVTTIPGKLTAHSVYVYKNQIATDTYTVVLTIKVHAEKIDYSRTPDILDVQPDSPQLYEPPTQDFNVRAIAILTKSFKRLRAAANKKDLASAYFAENRHLITMLENNCENAVVDNPDDLHIIKTYNIARNIPYVDFMYRTKNLPVNMMLVRDMIPCSGANTVDGRAFRPVTIYGEQFACANRYALFFRERLYLVYSVDFSNCKPL